MRSRGEPGGEGGQGGLTVEASLAVSLFGELRFRLNGTVLPTPDSARARSLLAFLLLHADAAQPRQRLAFVLWPDSSEGQARTNLRHLLHTMRQATPQLEPFLEVTPQTLRWRREASYSADVDAFEGALSRAEDPDADVDRALASLREALGYYSGDLLAAWYDEWLVGPRGRLRDQYLAALRTVTGLLAGRGEHAEAVRFARELVRSDPFAEDGYRLLIGLLDAAGDRAGAVRVYHECESTLSRELGIDPSRETRTAYEAVIRSDRHAEVEPAPTPGGEPSRLRDAVLVGRESEWRRLTERWREAEAGRAQLVVVAGEPGVGKTRLVEELRAWCAHRGAVVAEARSYPTEGELGFGVVSAWLRSQGLAGQVRRAPRADLAELARLVPELGTEPEDVEPPADAAEQRRRLFDAVARVLAASARPLLLVADDAQWCDEGSVQLIHYLVRRGLPGPLLIVATARREDLDDHHPLAVLMTGLRISDRCADLVLERLTRAGTQELAEHLLGRSLDASARDALHDETEGNPLFVIEAIRAGWDGSVETRATLSPKLQAVIEARLRQLSEPARELVAVAATVGRAFTAELVGRAAGVEEVVLVRGLDELWRRGLIREHDTDAYDFSHARIRDVAYEALSPAVRRRNHRLVAEALQEVHGHALATVTGHVATNYDRAGLVDDAVAWYLRAAVEAQRLDANVEAVRLLERARALVSILPVEGRIQRELAVLTALPTPLALVEGFASARLAEVQQRAIGAAAALGVEPEPELLRSIVMSSLCRDDFPGARTVALRLRDAAVRAGDDGLLTESTYLLGICAFWGGDLELARDHFERVVDRFRPQEAAHLIRFGHDPRIVCLSRLANTLWFLGRPDLARGASDTAIELAGDADPFSRSTAYIFGALLALDLDDAERTCRYAAALGNERDQPLPNELQAIALGGLADVLAGRVDGGIGRVRSAVARSGAVNHAPGFQAALMRLVVAAHAAAQDAEGGLAAADAALVIGGSRLWEAEVRRLRATFLATLHHPAPDIEAELRRALEAARRVGAGGHVPRIEHTRSALAHLV